MADQPLSTGRLGITFELREVDEHHAVCRMPFDDGVRNATNGAHAGALIWLADLTATFLARAGTEVAEDGRGFPMLIDLHASVLANEEGPAFIEAEARIVRRGRRVTVVRTIVKTDSGKVLTELTTTHIPW
ncbi:MAG: hotdog fold thioesterase [Dehalococcoidia bacterium]